MAMHRVLHQMPAPSASLLRTFLRPSSVQHAACRTQTRSTSNFMPRHKYAKVTRLDKLHRKQREDRLQLQEESRTRAKLLEESLRVTSLDASANPAPFHIGRTKTRNLAVYETTKAGGSKQITTIRLLSGDLAALQHELRLVLNLPDTVTDTKGRRKEPVAINHLTQQIVISGWRAPEVKKWAEVMGF